MAEWREKHTDWELLCAFISTQISRRHKNRTSAIIKNERILREREKIAEEGRKNKVDGNDESKHKNITSAIIKTERIHREREKTAEKERKNKADGNNESKMECESNLMKAHSKRTAVTSKVKSKTGMCNDITLETVHENH